MRFEFFHGYVCTANADGSIPLQSKVVAHKADDRGRVLISGEVLRDILNLAMKYAPESEMVSQKIKDTWGKE